MLVDFFFNLKRHGVPVTITELLSLLDAMGHGVAAGSVNDFYFLARTALVKDQRYFDRFDRAFSHWFEGAEAAFDEIFGEIPEDWLERQAELYLTDDEKEKIESLGGFEKLMETLKQRLAEQEKRHEGGNKMIGTAGRSPFGAYGYNPEGVRIGQHESRHRRAVKVWDKREYRDFDDSIEVGTRNIKIALRRLRRFAREGAADQLDLDGTIADTAKNAGYLDIRMRAERRNAIKVLLFLDVGGSMDDHVRVCEELFSAARSEFKHLEYFYFHNFLYERVWKENRRRHTERYSTTDILRTFGNDYHVIFIGDASMSPYEIMYPGGSVEHMNEESGAVWMQRLLQHFPRTIWLNPRSEANWNYTQSIQIIDEILDQRMFPLTLDGLERGTRALQRSGG